MSHFDLDLEFRSAGVSVQDDPDITSAFACTPGCITGAFQCATHNATNTCSFTK